MVNTQFDYLYRDAYNYKKSQSVILRGAMSENDMHAIMEKLDDGTFIAEQVGLPVERFEKWTIDDHPFVEFVSIENTDSAPTLEMSAAELADNFRKVDYWDALAYPGC